MGNPVVHFELNGPQGTGVAKFYSELFGWDVQTIPEMNYAPVDTRAGRGINGGFGQTQEGQPAYVTFFVAAHDLQSVLEKAESLGAKTVVPVTEQPNVATRWRRSKWAGNHRHRSSTFTPPQIPLFARFADPEGNIIAVVTEDDPEGQGKVSNGDNPGVEWFEVLGRDPRALWTFYGELFGWTMKDVSADGFVYAEVDPQSDRGIRGGIGSSPLGIPMVNIYAGVDDLQKYVERAESLGAKTSMPPTQVSQSTSVALFQDPQGTSFGLFKMTTA
jgi:predicted enzyme related to lactoylglutathione lyase